MNRALTEAALRRPLLIICCLLCVAGAAPPPAAASPGADAEVGLPGKDPALPHHHRCLSHLGHLVRSGEGIAGQNEWDVRFYEIAGEVDFEEPYGFDAQVTIWATPVEPTSVLILDALETLTVSAVTVDSAPATWDDSAEDLVTIPTPEAAVGVECEIVVEYRAEPNSNGFGWGCFVFPTYLSDGVRYTTCHTMTEMQYAGSWWPCIDRLTHKPEGVELFITVPDTMVVAANGVLLGVDTSTPGKRTYDWRTDHEIATYLVSMTVAPFADTHESAGPGYPWEESYTSIGGETFPLQYFVYREDLVEYEENILRNMDYISTMFDCFEAKYGPYPYRDEKYGIAEFIFSGGMEHQTISSIGRSSVTSSDSLNYVQHHELAHQWFGDKVSPATWEDIWLNEGFATYSEAIFYEYAARYTAGEYLYERRRLGNDELFDGSIYAPTGYFNHTVYWKGAWVLHMLRDLVGDDLFFETLSKWVDPAYSPVENGVATTAEFQAHAEAICGRDLETFFQNWVYGEGRPVYSHFFLTSSTPTMEWETQFVIEQTQAGTVFQDSLDVWFNLATGDTLIRIRPDQPRQVYDFTLDYEPLGVTLDPHHRLLHNASEIVIGSNGFRLVGATPSLNRVDVELIVVDPGRITAKIYDVNGRLVRRLHDAEETPGTLNLVWNGEDDAGEPCAASIYFCRIESSGHEESVKLLLLH